MSAHALLKLLYELSKSDKMQGLLNIFIVLSQRV